MSHANGVYPELMECYLKQGYGKCMALLVFHIHIASEVSLKKVKSWFIVALDGWSVPSGFLFYFFQFSGVAEVMIIHKPILAKSGH